MRMPETSVGGRQAIRAWVRDATAPTTVRPAVRLTVIVGVILTVINHGAVMLTGHASAGEWFRILLTICVPYVVSTVSTVSAVWEQRRRNAAIVNRSIGQRHE